MTDPWSVGIVFAAGVALGLNLGGVVRRPRGFSPATPDRAPTGPAPHPPPTGRAGAPIITGDNRRDRFAAIDTSGPPYIDCTGPFSPRTPRTGGR